MNLKKIADLIYNVDSLTNRDLNELLVLAENEIKEWEGFKKTVEAKMKGLQDQS